MPINSWWTAGRQALTACQLLPQLHTKLLSILPEVQGELQQLILPTAQVPAQQQH